MFTNSSTSTVVPVSNVFPQGNDDVEYIWLLKLSYLWVGVLGSTVTFIVGYVVSCLLDLFNLGGLKKIYLDTNNLYIDLELFSPPIARQLKKQNARILERESNVSICDITNICLISKNVDFFRFNIQFADITKVSSSHL